MDEIKEALAAIGEDEMEKLDAVVPAPERIPDKTVVAVKLHRDPNASGKWMEGVGKGWVAPGMAIALRRGHVVAVNHVLGHWSGKPKVTACHLGQCNKCGRTAHLPLLTWEAKDNARRKGIRQDLDRGISAWSLVRKYNPTCPCGGRWTDADEAEAAALQAFNSEVLKAIEASSSIGEFIPPEAFTVHPANEAVKLDPRWDWLEKAMANVGRAAVPIEERKDGDVIIYNPGFWLGFVDDPFATGLFFVEAGRDRLGRGVRFNPGAVDGL